MPGIFNKLLQKLGNDSPNTIATMIGLNCVALATIRPLMTLYNPNEPMERKKYAAMRESLSELIGLPIVVGVGLGFAKLVAAAFFKKNSLEADKEIIRKIFLVGGISTGNLMIPFITTGAIGALSAHTKKNLDAPANPKLRLNLQEPLAIKPVNTGLNKPKASTSQNTPIYPSPYSYNRAPSL